MVALHIKTEQQDSVETLADVVTMETNTDLSKHEMNLALNQDVMLHVEYNCQKYDNHVTIKTEPLPLNSVNMGHLIADTDENLAVKSENQSIGMLDDDGNKEVKLESSLHDSCDFDQNKMLKREPDSTELAVFAKTADMMHIHHSKEPLKTSANTLPLNNPGTGTQDNRLVETIIPITDTSVPENDTKTFTLFKPETGEVLIIKAEMNATIIESETEAEMNATIIESKTETKEKQLLKGESIVKENDLEAAKISKTIQREMQTQKSKPREIKKMGYLLKEGEHFKIREDGVFKYKCLLCGKIFQNRNQFEKHAQKIHFKFPCYVNRSRLHVITPEEIWPCARRMTSEANALPDRYDGKITKKAETEKETYVLLYNVETKQNKEQEKEYTKVCDQVQGQPEKGKSQIGSPVFMYNQVTGEVQKVEIEIGNSNTSNGKEIRASRPSNVKEIRASRPSNGKASEAQSAFQNLLMNKMTNRCINDITKQENIFPINNSGFDEEYSPSHTVSTASKHDDCTSRTPSMHQAPTASNHDDGHSTIDDQVIMVKNSNHTIKEQNQEIKKKNWYKYNYACGNCTSAFPRMIDLIKHHNTCEREATTCYVKKTEPQKEDSVDLIKNEMNKHPVNVKQTKPQKDSVHVDLIENGMNKRPCSDLTLSRMKKRLKCKSEIDITFDINTMHSNSQVENEDIPQKGRKRKREKSYPYSCSVCKAAFCTVNSLLQHKNECESNQVKKEDQQSEIITKNNRHLITQFKLSKNVHFEIIKTGFGVVRCILCGKENECFEDFSYHAKSKHFPYQCFVCPAFFTNMVDLCQHSIACVYIKGQGYRCPVCQKILHSKKLLRVHCEDDHTVYICFLCNSEFDDQKILDLHKQTCS
ncbi:Hypothetical predicted protein [Mytilus galloprovincialis]|uniref:C2H2-type domain-containing protein n=1 Tax=Mytilus galloprovincialis TaxID=29158 RepID=A0A8B6D4Z5_MYTGA|nr:Hypothetical predicted protein [Mytilus galloprovincialis]